jgi:catechol 2,3-dioxygenase-like lactoylglutathione lyase family enzyme
MPDTVAKLATHFGLHVQPMVHVQDLAKSIDFYEALGGHIVFGDRDADWALIGFGHTTISLLAHPPGDGNFETVELQFVSAVDLHDIETHLNALDPALVEKPVAHETFGRILRVKTPDGLLIKILHLDRERTEG